MVQAKTHPISRRTLISGTAVASTLAMPAAAGAMLPGNDPIFAAIQRHRDAWAATFAIYHTRSELEDTLPRELRQTYIDAEDEKIVQTDDPRWIATERAGIAGWKATNAAADAMLDICPTTIAGVAALLAYVYEHEKKQGADSAWPEGYVDEESEDDWDRQHGVSWAVMLHKSLAEALPGIAA